MRQHIFGHWAIGLLIAFGVFSVLSICEACSGETCTLQFMPAVPKADEANGKWYPPTKYLRGGAQSFRYNLDAPFKDVGQERRLEAFAKVVTKEPTYVMKKPFKGLIRLGDQCFACVFDVAAKEEKTDGKDQKTTKKKKKKYLPFFCRLYIDRNENGDLTDDEPIETSTPPKKSSRSTSSYFKFTLPIRQEGKTFETPCRFKAQSVETFTYYSNSKRAIFPGLSADFYAGFFREGKITLGDKTFRVFLIDGNSNGRFNDPMTHNMHVIYDSKSQKDRQKNGFSPKDVFYLVPEEADHFRFAPRSQPGKRKEFDSYYVGGMVGVLEGKFWDVKITPSGNKLTLTPRTEGVGFLQNQGHPFKLQAASKEGPSFLTLRSDENGKTPLPPGEWILLNYAMEIEEKKTVDNTSSDTTENPSEKEKRPSSAFVVADFNYFNDVSVTIEKNKTKTLKFGPPYHLTLSSRVTSDGGDGKPPMVRLSLASLEGELGDSCWDAKVDGKRPPKPTFTIKTKDGKTVHEGVFEYG